MIPMRGTYTIDMKVHDYVSLMQIFYPLTKKIIPHHLSAMGRMWGTLIGLTLAMSALGAPLHAERTPTLNEKGIELGNQKKYDQAIELFEQSLQGQNAASAIVMHNLGWVYEMKGDVKNAIRSYRGATERNPRQVASWERLGFLLYKTGDYLASVRAGEAALKIEPDNRNVIGWLTEARKQIRTMYEEGTVGRFVQEKEAQEEQTRPGFLSRDIFLKAGYVPIYEVMSDELERKSFAMRGFATMLETNIFLKWVWVGIDFEWQRTVISDEIGYYQYDFLNPGISIKHVLDRGFFMGIGFSGKSLIAVNNPSANPVKARLASDLWGYIIMGYYLPISTNFALMFENRFGCNLTNNTFREYTGTAEHVAIGFSYDMTFYLGIGWRFYTADQRKD